jgi:putative SOS response-associated peptidase YedK
MIKADIRRLARLYGFEIEQDPGEHTDHIVPHRLAPIVVKNGDKFQIKAMKFSLLPSWSKEPKVKFATHNARLETIDTKPTWKQPFLSKRCIVPMTSFIEPIYIGDYAGYMVEFRAAQDGTMFAAGIWDQWLNKQTGEVVESFAVITSDPIPFVEKIGHDRTPVFIQKSAWDSWLLDGKRDSNDLKQILTSSVDPVTLEVFRDRAMRPGWEKRK